MLEFLDGGMIYELNKIHQDLGQTALLTQPDTILQIYQSYLIQVPIISPPVTMVLNL